MSYTDDESGNDNINEYNDSDSSDFGEDDTKVKLLSKKQKQTMAFQKLVREAKLHFNNSEFLNFQHDLKEINNEIIKNKWQGTGTKMPKFFVKHMLEIHTNLKAADPKSEKNQKEQRALKSLQKNFKKELRHFKQLSLFGKSPQFWKDEDSDLGTADNDENMEESDEDDNVLYSLQDAATQEADESNDDTTAQSVDEEDDDENEDENEEEEEEEEEDDEDDDDDDDDDEEGSESIEWSSWSARGDEAEEEKDDDDDEVTDDEDNEEDKKDDEGDKEKTFGIEAFDEETLAKMRFRSFWVKKSKKKKKKLGQTRQKRLTKQKKLEEQKEAIGKDVEKPTRKPKAKKRGRQKWSVTRIQVVFQSVLTDRGKSSVNREQIVSRLEELIEQCEIHNAEQARLTAMSVLISFYFDTASRKTTGMSGTRWRKTRTLVTAMCKSLSQNIDKIRVSNDADIRLILREDASDASEKAKDGFESNIDWMNALQSVKEEEEEDGTSASRTDEQKKQDKKDKKDSIFGGFSVINTDKKKKKLDPKYQWVPGNLLSFLKKITDQLWNNLKALGMKSVDLYTKRKKNAELLMSTYKKAVYYFGQLEDKDTQSQIEVLAMSVIHSDYNPKIDELNEVIKRNAKQMTSTQSNSKKKKRKKISCQYGGQQILNLPKCLIVSKAIFVFENGSRRCQTQAMLYLIYFMALHNRYELSRDLLLMSHLGSSSRIGTTNVELQILYNRALAQYAVCSFRGGYWYSAMIILQELYASNRIKILLAQGYTKAQLETASAEQIKLEQLQQSRMLPPHFHIPSDLLEATHLLSALFIEIPNMINNSYNKSFIRNPYFRKVWHQYLRRDLRVPPENTKDYILTTAIAMQNGEWLKCKEIINRLKLWKDMKHVRYVKKKVFSMAKRQCLRCYLYRYGSVYRNISLQRLSEMFDISLSHTKQFVSKLIITAGQDSRFASLDELTQCVVMHQTPPMPIQRTALEYSDKLSYLIEQNEKLLGIYSRYSSYGGGGYKGKSKYDKSKYKDDKGKYKNKNQMKGRKTGGKSRFTRAGISGQQSTNKASSTNKSQFGRGQNTRAQLRSIRPRT